ncbi:NAD(P)-dependent oxidoreductase [Cupriavidus plantarum]|uniref:D-3-phosphoglycerate dehydrogenase n=1 Tax=Cupriavidus plantarum TaxID=942865 RepID=A0A316FJB5_9BURK|nr:NAD(P)-dependent oxidoreductase [Cupriavidus plantarum]PWK37700.1 D-3-phosphoglycerate dehydrogenase [Cupriavidus plantarum]RLK45547.1 D-3-phosphoglycerate dehydrogenase [Cupriavidus plantarum]CAG2128100.1 Glyoxylate/hydroxypyruvate reductase B [Cupriavidus plantarum]SMR66720.1 D-3-phosphoglycerate dehydrogenase [Cupriavidus plantarum]
MTSTPSSAKSTSDTGAWRAVFVDANPTLTEVSLRLRRADDLPLEVNQQPDIKSEGLPAALAGAPIAIIDHTHLPTEIARQCKGLKHVVFLGTGARSYMNPEELAELGITVHTIKGYGDTAVAECAFGLMWAAARNFARMDREMRAGNWLRSDAVQLTGKTIGLVGFGGIAAELARLARGMGMRVLAWNRTPKTHEGVEFVELDALLAQSDVVSLHLLLNDETRGMITAERIARMRDGAILINTARGALVDEDAMIAALRSGKISHAGLDVFTVEPMPAGHVLTTLPNVTLSAHSAFRTPEANNNLIEAALDHCRNIVRNA